jgi:clan AA aspartic protease (TIGR02281 family)
LAAALLALSVGIAGSAGAAAAKDLRYPVIGPVAFLLHLPEGWSASAGQNGSLIITQPGAAAGIFLTVTPEDARSMAETPDELATAMLAKAKAEPFSKHERGAISGAPADTYYSEMANSVNGQPPEPMMLNMIKSVRGYVVVEAILTSPNINTSQRAELAMALKGITLTGVAQNPSGAKVAATPARPAAASNAGAADDPAKRARTDAPSNTAHVEVPLKSLGGTFVVPVFINGAITLNFIVDSGAADVAVPADVVGTLIRTGTIEKSDFIGKQKYVLADGSVSPTSTFTIRSLKVGDIVMENVKGSVSPAAGELLLGQSFLQRFKSWSIDNNKHVLVLEQ